MKWGWRARALSPLLNPNVAPLRLCGSPSGQTGPAEAVDGEAVGDGAALSGAPGAVWILGEARGAVGVAAGNEPRIFGDQLLVARRALVDVSLDEELPPGLEEPSDLAEKVPLDEQALRVSLLPPRIREVDEEATHRAVRAEAREREACVFGEHPGPRAIASGREARIDDRRPLAADLEPHEHGAGLGFGALHEEPPPPGSQLDLDPLAVRQRAELDTVRFGQARRVVVRPSHGHAFTRSEPKRRA